MDASEAHKAVIEMHGPPHLQRALDGVKHAVEHGSDHCRVGAFPSHIVLVYVQQELEKRDYTVRLIEPNAPDEAAELEIAW